jgi:hypothetical protein
MAPAENLAAYGFGRALLKSYSGRMSSGPSSDTFLARFFFIRGTFAECGYARGDETNAPAPFCEHDGEQPVAQRETQENVALLVDGMLDIVDQLAERIVEDGNCFGEEDAMLPDVVGRLSAIPFERKHSPNVFGRLCTRLTRLQLSCGVSFHSETMHA